MGADPQTFTADRLVFLVSQPRAGSTMLQRILVGHPEVHTTAEPWLMLHPLYAMRTRGHQADYDATLANEALVDFTSTLPRGMEEYREALRRMTLHLYGAACEPSGARLFLDKTPRYYLVLDDLATLFPEARFVILLRNPLAVLDSVLRTFVKSDLLLLARHRLDLLRAPVSLADFLTRDDVQSLPVHYEQLVRDPRGEVGRLCQWLKIEFEPEMLEYGRRPPPGGRMGDTGSVARYPSPSRAPLGTWLEMARDAQARHLALAYLDALGPGLLARLGYDAQDLRARLESVQCSGGVVGYTWRQLFAPDARLSRRIYHAELALIAWRRAVRRFRAFWRGASG